MGHKVNPNVIRLNITRIWPSRWFATGKNLIKNLEQDVKLKKYLFVELREAGLDRVEIERSGHKITIGIFTAKPGIIIGRGGSGAGDLKKKLHVKFLKNFRLSDINLNISEFDRPNLSSAIIAGFMAMDIEKRMPFRRVMKQAISRIERAGALGVKVIVSGRLNGADIARTEMLTSGKVPLHTFRADIDFARATARTTYGTIGIKLWIYKGDVFKKESETAKGEVVGERK
ncbi:30S ribosomal protein S3 [Candidatus Falkowbacteria bacterium RIFCSPLOWO2_12_FULL_45_13]|uniref:Small ribosomal subunit protein uS3 n=2 Tax=Candidatus Falkowiibacteriota TaxID=1752728 RepID=A0A1F5SAP2_9BACT|nr:MAG: 30S ribosomal protein S3 [Candidatus Falkowbacteria bacterium RIFCSPLOWO2_02_FULL_45_21]OGF32042.1 MAG: 30S ribosomal protein S3 [Candidatus Falkowbacteria bacterium RIFCSPLOWO2_12_FULL_45_13]